MWGVHREVREPALHAGVVHATRSPVLVTIHELTDEPTVEQPGNDSGAATDSSAESVGWLTGFEPATPGATIQCSTS
jgi:hypothetical protein